MTQPSSNVASGPKCPSCGQSQFSFTEIAGPLDRLQQLRTEFKKAKREYDSEAALALQQGKTAEEEAFLFLNDNPDAAAHEIKQLKLSGIQQQYARTKRSILLKIAGSHHGIAVIHCVSCGHIVGSTALPEQHEKSTERLEQGIFELQKAITELHQALVIPTLGIRKHTTELNQRESKREQSARIIAAQEAINSLLADQE